MTGDDATHHSDSTAGSGPAQSPAVAAVDPASPIAHDVFCADCRYNLRGLAGDPVRCPECFRSYARAALELDAANTNARRELLGAADALLLGVMVAVAGLALSLCGGVLLMVYALILIGPAISDFRARFRGRRGWVRLVLKFVAVTLAMPLALLAALLGSMLACGYALSGALPRAAWLAAAAVGGAIGLGLGVGAIRALGIMESLRTEQRLVFERMFQLMQQRDGAE